MNNSNKFDIATCIYSRNWTTHHCTIESLYVNNGRSLTPLISAADSLSAHKSHEYDCFRAMFTAIVRTLENNHRNVHVWNDFGATWYNIQFIDVADPSHIRTYSGITPQ